MGNDSYRTRFPSDTDVTEETHNIEEVLPPWLFKHQELIRCIDSAPTITGKQTANKINHLHFRNRPFYIIYRTISSEEGIVITASPAPCVTSAITCHIPDKTAEELRNKGYQPQYVIIPDDHAVIVIPAHEYNGKDGCLVFALPDSAYSVATRKTTRYRCNAIDAVITQNGFSVDGTMVNFSPEGFRIHLTNSSRSPLNWFNPDAETFVYLRDADRMLFSGACRFIRQSPRVANKEMVFAPVNDAIARFPSSRFRNPRLTPDPPAILSFYHPFARKRQFKREVVDLSTSGFCVRETVTESVLMTGMIIPDLTIRYIGALDIHCMGQVIYRREETDGMVLCGIAIIDITISSYSMLSQILNYGQDYHSSISSSVDMDALWEFFFSTGFIYPQKYDLLHTHREEFTDMYNRLYQESPDIARHFTYEKDGDIYGHLSMVRAYEKAWLIQHHAARPLENTMPGFQILKHVMLFLHGIYHFPSAHLDFAMCFFRKDNKFPERIFGDFARSLNNPHKCSLDLFGYLTYTKGSSSDALPDDWELRDLSPLDAIELRNYYDRISGGLLLDTIGLEERDSPGTIEDAYTRAGFVRHWHAYALLNNGMLSAVLIANHSNAGLNLSDLLNGIMIITTSPEGPPRTVLTAAVERLAAPYQQDRVPLLLYPSPYGGNQGIFCDKYYQLWITDMRYSQDFMEYMQTHFRMRYP